MDWIGKSRVIQGKKSIEEINPDVQVEIFNERTTPDNAERLLENADIALSARPNFMKGVF